MARTPQKTKIRYEPDVVPAARGSTIMATLEFLSSEKSASVVQRVLAALSKDERTRITTLSATDEVPLTLPSRLWRAVDAEIGKEDPGWAERAGAFSIELRGVQSYGGILKKTTPAEFLTQHVSLFKLYYHGGDMKVVERQGNRATLRLLGFEAADRDQLFCRRQTGGLERALSISGGKSAKVRHVRCAVEGDAFCEWDVRWDV
ncbi:MAG TPA: hypothetical protein VM939_10800 [Gemmatimonadaceae bacterium]|nr:hypothetical protein [Gemmatimonadaceae bacterium]